MLRSIQLENFKAFGQRTVIPLAPITLIFGQNSAGKSSILQALSLMKQTIERGGEDSVLLMRLEKGIVDLGSFQDLLYRHDLQRDLVIRLDIDSPLQQKLGTLRILNTPHSGLGMSWTFSRPSLSEELRVKQFKVLPTGSEEPLVVYDYVGTVGLSPRLRSQLTGESDAASKRKNASAVKCVYLSRKQQYWDEVFLSVKQNIAAVIKTLRKGKAFVQKALSPPPTISEAEKDIPFGNWWEESLESFSSVDPFTEAIRYYKSDFDIDSFIERVAAAREGGIYGLNGLLVRSAAGADLHKPSVETYLFHYLSVYSNELAHGLDPLYIARNASDTTEMTLRRLFPLGPYRQAPERFYIFTGTSPKNVGIRGQLLPDLLFRNTDLVANANEWLARLEIGYEIEVRTLGPTIQDIFEIRLKDVRQTPPVEVGIPDVGFGVSQLLPLIVQSLASSEQIITVEQPEVHIHPKLQADLGDLLIESIREPRRNQFIIETHSEHLALRIQRRVREKAISPEDVSILYVSRGPEGATVQQLRLDEEGDFIEVFPGGFFPERLRELR